MIVVAARRVPHPNPRSWPCAGACRPRHGFMRGGVACARAPWLVVACSCCQCWRSRSRCRSASMPDITFKARLPVPVAPASACIATRARATPCSRRGARHPGDSPRQISSSWAPRPPWQLATTVRPLRGPSLPLPRSIGTGVSLGSGLHMSLPTRRAKGSTKVGCECLDVLVVCFSDEKSTIRGS